MKTLTNSMTLLYVIVLFSSCETYEPATKPVYKTNWVVPPYTSVSKIINLGNGMTIKEVNQTLDIEPYDVYTLQENGLSIFVYNYRIKNRRMTLTGQSREDIESQRHSEQAQKGGEIWYKLESYRLFVMFKFGKLKSLITESGKKESEMLLVTNNNIQLISRKELITLKSDSPLLKDRAVIIPLENIKTKWLEKQLKKSTEEQSELSEKIQILQSSKENKKSGGAGRVLLALSIIGLLITMSILTIP